MPLNRPYFNHGVEKLEVLFLTYEKDLKALQALEFDSVSGRARALSGWEPRWHWLSLHLRSRTRKRSFMAANAPPPLLQFRRVVLHRACPRLRRLTH